MGWKATFHVQFLIGIEFEKSGAMDWSKECEGLRGVRSTRRLVESVLVVHALHVSAYITLTGSIVFSDS